LVSYNDKHNSANGEDNRDGDNHNLSWNCGAEGFTDNGQIVALRERQVRNFAVLLMLSRGVPMILSGDEMGRSQQGNNNAYCQDNPISWLDWGQLETNRSLFRFFRLLIAFRKSNGLLRFDSFLVKDGYGTKIQWHGCKLGQPDWGAHSRCLAMHMSGSTRQGNEQDIFLIANAYWEARTFELPVLPGQNWRRFVDTSLPSDQAITELDKMQPLDQQHAYTADGRSVIVLVAHKQ